MDSAPEQLAGLRLVDRPPLSAEDLELLREYLQTRRQKLSRSRLRLIGFAAVVLALLVVIDGQRVLHFIGWTILAFAFAFAVPVMIDWRRQRVLVEKDLKAGYLCRYEGVVGDVEHALVKAGLLRRDCACVQRLDVLPVSRKLHRTNDALQWTWCQVRG